jgi:hypothetical protein
LSPRYELWDVETATIISDYPSVAAAEDDVQRLQRHFPEMRLVLTCDSDGELSLVRRYPEGTP